MQLLTPEQTRQLLANGRALAAGETLPHALRPVAKLFTPDAGCTWLIAALDPEDPDQATALCDLATGFVTIEKILMSDFQSLTGPLCLPIKSDPGFQPAHTLRGYQEQARANGNRILD